MNTLWNSQLGTRQLTPEMMDATDIHENQHRSALRGLGRVNAICLTHRSLWNPIHRMALRHAPAPLRVLDVACGGGDVAVRMALTARRLRLPISIDGCDKSSMAITVAQERANVSGVSCQFFPFDVTSNDWPEGYDVIMTSLFLHHLPTETAVQTLKSMSQAPRKMVLVNDLVRSRMGYLYARFGGYLLSRSPIVHSDGPTSVAGAFTREELSELGRRAGLRGATVKLIWPERMLLEWSRP